VLFASADFFSKIFFKDFFSNSCQAFLADLLTAQLEDRKIKK